MIAQQISEPRTANWIASETDWSHEPTKRILERLVERTINDLNERLTTFYEIVRDELDALITENKTREDSEAYFYES